MDKIQIPKTKLRGEDGHKMYSLRVPDDLAEEIDDIVSKTELSRNEVLNILIREAVKLVEFTDSKDR